MNMSNWQDIETAPLDGDMILIRDPKIDGGVAVAFYAGDRWQVPTAPCLEVDPTHWCPIDTPVMGFCPHCGAVDPPNTQMSMGIWGKMVCGSCGQPSEKEEWM